MTAVRELSEAHGGAAACSACASERGVREWEWSSRDVALLSACWPNRPGHRQRIATMWCHDLAWLATNGTRCPVQTQPSGHLTAQVQAISTPNPWRVSKNSITKNYRATRDLQLCLNEVGLIQAGFQIAKLQSMVQETVNQFLQKFLSLKTTFC